MTEFPRILVTGSNGQLGWELCRTLACLGRVVATDSRSLDLSDESKIRQFVRRTSPDVIVNAAAYTAVDRAESERELACTINTRAPGVMAEEAGELGSVMVHFSTDYVFNGSGERPWKEDDMTGPLNVYGASKLAGEEAVRKACARHLVLRTSWVYAMRGKNFLLTMLRLLKEREEMKIVGDQIGAPTWSRMLAEATATVLARQLSSMDDQRWGTCHMTCQGETSWYGFASAIREMTGPGNLAQLVSISSSEYPTPAQRPLNSRLNNDKLFENFGIRLPSWQDALRLCLQT